MSASIAAARKRRGIAEKPAPLPAPVINQPVGLTLPQVIALVDKRLGVLETFMKDQKENQPSVSVDNTANQSLNMDVVKVEMENMAEEFNSRYELLATEIQSIKDIVLKLQSYTMDVNKILMEERVRILSDVEHENITIDDEAVSYTHLTLPTKRIV